ncbi:MAG: pyridoxamine 5'-phosphate oxidase family protein [Sulfurospirillum cavolei]|nr:pyridoxamine 5'-phosphate oxidase family protein [Sulfurospirillum cavolei]
MRRAEFEVNDLSLIEEVLNSCEYGTLSLVDGDEPYGVPINFAWHENRLGFHGSLEGRKMDVIARNAKASFSVVKPLSLLPSYFSNTRSACPASQLYISVMCVGVVKVISDLHVKCEMLNALMQKLQPEGGYDPIEADNPVYTKVVERLGICVLEPTSMSLKVKVGQNLTEERRTLLVEKLRQRDSAIDRLSLKVIQQLNEQH